MTLNQIKLFIGELGITSLKVNGNWIMASCPFARYRHTHGKDINPSFCISIADHQESLWHCFSCSPTPRTLFSLIQELWLLSGKYSHKASKILMNEAYLPREEVEVRVDFWDRLQPKTVSIPSYIVESFTPILKCDNILAKKSVHYLMEERHITEEVIDRYDLRFCEVNEAIIFPFTNSAGEIMCLKARKAYTKDMWAITPEFVGHPWLSFPSIQAAGVFFGMHLIKWNKPITLLEGEMDMLRLASLGYDNSLSAGTCTLSKAQAENLHGVNYRVAFDADQAGKKGIAKAINLLRGNGSIISTLDWGIAECKDPGDLVDKQQLDLVIEKMVTVAW